ncbi:HNH endonuclease family protein [Novosphingobium aerophilum]|uniref:HNH endonuclease family protein n=1 Tax=Novosphingobium aerophilum TaxID=2839843 RepID=UPI003FD4590C
MGSRQFLRYYVLATWGVTKLREDELYDWFVKNESKVGFAADPIAFVDRLQLALDAYLNFFSGKGRDGQPDPALESISLLAGGATRQHLVMLLAGRDLPAELFTELCVDVEALLFTYLITRQTNREFEVMFPEWAPELAGITTQADYEQFAERTLRKRRQELSSRFRREFQALNGQFLRQYQLRYILGKLTQAVDRSAYGATAQTSLWLSRYCDGSNVHIEHILPQSSDDVVRQEFGPDADNPEVLWSIGNLALVEKSINTSLGRKPFSYKRGIYPQSQFLLTRVIGQRPDIGNTAIDRAVSHMAPFESWTHKDVTQRAAWLADLACAVWSIPALDTEIIEAA